MQQHRPSCTPWTELTCTSVLRFCHLNRLKFQPPVLKRSLNPTPRLGRRPGLNGYVMADAGLVLVVSLLFAFLVRIYWRLIVNVLVTVGISLIFAAILFLALAIVQVNDSI